MKIVFIRHGATLGNTQGRYVGRTDEPLLPESIRQLEQRKMEPVELVISSPMKRCIQTAERLYPTVPLVVEPLLREMDFGEFEYKNYQELNENMDYQKYIDSGGTLAFPGGEEPGDFKNRCCQGFQRVLELAKKRNVDSLALVVHGGTIMSILEAKAFPRKDYFQWQIKNGQKIEGELDDQGSLFIREG